jgi:redox-sensitive bicupin YhaK (pirin superfamily)
MVTLCRDSERRHLQHGKQDTWHTLFSKVHPGPPGGGFGDLVDFNEMRLPPGDSTEIHSGDEAELITFVFKGALSQKDTAGTSGLIRAGEFQRMSTGHRIRHRETNASRSNWAHVFRISLRPSEVGLDPAREQQRFTAAQRRNDLCVVASPDGRKGSLHIHQDALVYSSILDPGHHLFHELLLGRSAWLHILCGEATLNDIVLTQGDGVGVTNEPSVSLTVQETTEVLLIDVSSLPRSSPTGVVP